MFRFTSASECPVETHPGRSGTYALKLFGPGSITIAYLFSLMMQTCLSLQIHRNHFMHTDGRNLHSNHVPRIAEGCSPAAHQQVNSAHLPSFGDTNLHTLRRAGNDLANGA